MLSFSLGFASATLPCNSTMMIANNTFLSSKSPRNIEFRKGFREPFLCLPRFSQNNVQDIASSRNMAITDKGNSRDVCVAAIAAPPTITDMARESRDGIGIIDFLERRNFLVTGATGFLAKGNENKPLKMCVS